MNELSVSGTNFLRWYLEISRVTIKEKGLRCL